MKSSHPAVWRPRLLVVGAGFLGARVARQARAGGWEVVPVVRSVITAQALAPEFPGVMAADAVREDFWEKLPPLWAGLVWAVSPSPGQESRFHDLHRRGTKMAAQWAIQQRAAMITISSTSIYAEDSGGWVDEQSPLAWSDDRSAVLAEAEKVTREAGGSVLRCAGIYGPGRELKTGAEGPERWLNVVQVDDAVRAVGLVLGLRGEIYNVCEDEPLRRGKAGGQWPKGKRARRSKRVCNTKLRGLGWQPRWQAGETVAR